MSTRVSLSGLTQGQRADSLSTDQRLARIPIPSHRRTIITVSALVAISLAVSVVAVATDPQLPSSQHWYIVGILAAVGIVGALVSAAFGPPDDDSGPPWDVHTVWLLPAAILTPPLAFAGLIVLSVTLTLLKRSHPHMLRAVVSSITVITTFTLYGCAQLFTNFVLGGFLGIVALWLIGFIIAILVAHVFMTPAGTAVWLDIRWSFVVLGCAFSGLLIAGAVLVDPLLGLAALAPLLFASFALQWPELDRHARIDAKTGLPNARHWEERSQELLTAASLHDLPVSVLMLDVDRFKLVNDTYGHLAGDQVLVDLAATLRAQVDADDMVGRFGGEEFALTMFGLSPAEAGAAAERIRTAVAARNHSFTQVSSDDPDQTEVTAAHFTITCTIGVASSEHYGYDLRSLLNAADSALVRGKSSGRDQVQRAKIATDDASGENPAGAGPMAAQMGASWKDAVSQRVAARRAGRSRK